MPLSAVKKATLVELKGSRRLHVPVDATLDGAEFYAFTATELRGAEWALAADHLFPLRGASVGDTFIDGKNYVVMTLPAGESPRAAPNAWQAAVVHSLTRPTLSSAAAAGAAALDHDAAVSEGHPTTCQVCTSGCCLTPLAFAPPSVQARDLTTSIVSAALTLARDTVLRGITRPL